MIKLSQKHQQIISIILRNGQAQSSEIHKELTKSGEKISLVTVKRMLSELAGEEILIAVGKGRGARYDIGLHGRVFADVDAEQYVAAEPDVRYGSRRFNFDLLKAMPAQLFSDVELQEMEKATDDYRKRTTNLPLTIQKKELERLVIELSWKSSRIEGNTYTLLDTERLILENKEAPGHSKEEARMILNHKEAFSYIYQNSMKFKTITKKNLEDLHAILVKDLSVASGLRTKPVGITGSIYRPLDNVFQISEAVSNLTGAVSRMRTPYDKALTALVGIGYIQPFEDGNKRTSRLMANAILLANSCSPLSYRSINENDYREAMLVFYELNSIVPMKKIFIDQYEFAAKNYAVK